MNDQDANPIEVFKRECVERVAANGRDQALKEAAVRMMREMARVKYSYNMTWLGRPILQGPQELVAMQEIIWKVKPDLIIETGIAHGGSLVFYASMLEILGRGKIVGIDIDIRPHNRAEIEKHPLFHRMTLVEGSSVDQKNAEKICQMTVSAKKIMVCLDSNHTHDHVFKELEIYAPLVSVGSYCVVFDTGIEFYDDPETSGRPWGPGNSPMSAVWHYLKNHPEFRPDLNVDNKYLLIGSPSGYLERIS
ncbi:MAG: cephalosporin hydroxylase family protein [Verrucomicrobiae bacterium]|nr:cephalosporin hydroxylase family protein [Verrucomicrobiae bacterium]